MSNKEQVNYWNPSYPQQPCYDGNCGVNEIYKTLPAKTRDGTPWPWERIASGPSSIKHIYTGIPNWYPIRRINRPVGTMYESDFGLYEAFGKRSSYHWKAYPLTHRNAREVRVYKDEILPYMDNESWTRHPIRWDASLNNPTGALQL